MPSIRECTFTAIDFESAGSAPGVTDVPVQVGVASWSAERGIHDPWVSYLYTDQPITWSAQKVHGITTDDLVGAPSLLSLWPTLRDRLVGNVVVAHSAGTEKRFLRAFPGAKFGPWVDTLHLARAAWPNAASHKLGELCDAVELSPAIAAHVPGKKWHDALYDAVASLAILEHYVTNAELADLPLEHLTNPDLRAYHAAQKK